MPVNTKHMTFISFLNSTAGIRLGITDHQTENEIGPQFPEKTEKTMNGIKAISCAGNLILL